MRRTGAPLSVACFSLAGILLCTQAARSGPYASMYSRAELQRAGGIYGPNLRGIWLQDLQGELTLEERGVAARTSLELPLVGAAGTPFEFYTDTVAQRVTVPIFSVKFLDDLFIAITWLDRRGCDVQAAFDYISMLRYQSPASLPGGRFPSPQRALGVPEGILEDEAIDTTAQNGLKSTIYFLMAHELAHVLYRHRGYDVLGVAAAQRQESEADSFALRVMRRIAVPPVGMSVFFSAVSRIDPVRADFGNAAEFERYMRTSQTHPLSPERLLAISEYMRQNVSAFSRIQPNPEASLPLIRRAAGDIERLAGLLADPQIRAVQRRQGLGRSFDDLRRSCVP